MDNHLVAAEVFPPGEFLRDELEARGWTQAEFARILDRPEQAVSEIVTGKKRITPETARALSGALGSSPEYWLNLESSYRLFLAGREDENVARRSRLYSLAPLGELRKRGYLPGVDWSNMDEVERGVCEFLSISSVHEAPAAAFAARVSATKTADQRCQVAWVSRVRRLAESTKVAGYAEQRLREVAPTLAELSTAPEKMAALPKALDDAGVRLVFVPDIKGARIDGAALWLDEESPVAALSLRHDRIDCFWFTLMHELAHIILGHGRKADIVDNDLVGKDAARPDTLVTQERQADRLAGDWLIPPKAFRGFVKSTKPYFWRSRVEEFASRLKVHPGIVVGRLQYEGHIPWRNLRNLQERVRGHIESLGRLDAVPSSHSR